MEACIPFHHKKSCHGVKEWAVTSFKGALTPFSCYGHVSYTNTVRGHLIVYSDYPIQGDGFMAWHRHIRS